MNISNPPLADSETSPPFDTSTLEKALAIASPAQVKGINRMAAEARRYNFDLMGLGKSMQSILALRKAGSLYNLVIAKRYGLGVWEEEIPKWWPGAKVFEMWGTPKRREKARNDYAEAFRKNDGTPLFLTTTSALIKEVRAWRAGWGGIVYDEAHNYLINKDTVTYEHASMLASKYCYILTGSPTRRHAWEVFGYLRILDPQNHTAYWSWVEQWFHTVEGPYAREILQPKNKEAFRAMLQTYGVRRLDKSGLPKFRRQLLPVEGSAEFMRFYNDLKENLVAEHGKDLLCAPNSLALNNILRQLTTCPEMLGLELESPVVEASLDLSREAQASGQAVVLFTPFRAGVDMLSRRMAAVKGDKIPVFSMHGGKSKKHNDSALADFRNSQEAPVLVCTVGMAESWSAVRSQLAIFCGYDYTPTVNQQAEGRIDRKGQTLPTRAIYVAAKRTLDMHVKDIIEGKTTWTEAFSNFYD